MELIKCAECKKMVEKHVNGFGLHELFWKGEVLRCKELKCAQNHGRRK